MPPVLESTAAPQETLYTDVISGLQETPPTIPSKYLYDSRGALLFSRICELEEYYPTRTELALTRAHAPEIAERLGAQTIVTELGTGDGRKTRILLRHLQQPATYIPVDISATQLQQSARALRREFPQLQVLPLCVDYTDCWTVPCESIEGRRVFYFPGSTIGNFKPRAARRFLTRLSAMAGPDGALVIGVDLKKEPAVLQAAYNDRHGVTAAFNLNLLRRLNRECRANFDPDCFRHRAVYQPELGRIEMRLVSTCSQQVQFPTHQFHFTKGEFIVTEHSYKFQVQDFARLSEVAHWRTRSIWIDEQQHFSLWYLTTITPHDE